jgi:hypothetical protein
MKAKNVSYRLALAITASILAPGGARAFDLSLGTNLPPVDFHGFVSQGFLASDDYNYLGDTTHGSFQFTEAGVNAAFNPFPRTRISVQGFTYDVGPNVGKYDLVLDYAQAEYTFSDYLGIRAGRICRPQGIYNDIQDVDLARTSILLPQGIYDARWRDFYVGLDGVDFFGAIPLGDAGNLSYDVYVGAVQPTLDGGIANLLQSVLPSFVHLDSIDPSLMSGLQLWYNTPVNGLRFGVAGSYVSHVAQNFTASTPFGTFNSTTKIDIPDVEGSAEYLWKSWTFQAEYNTYIQNYDNAPSMRTDAWYASAAYRFNKRVQAGAYYSEYYSDTSQRGNPLDFQKDTALSLRFDLKDWWIFKVEGHYIHGTGELENNAQPINRDDRGWFMFGVKTTFSF